MTGKGNNYTAIWSNGFVSYRYWSEKNEEEKPMETNIAEKEVQSLTEAPGQTGKIKKLVILRHGESVWNRENRFTGTADVDLSNTGIEEAAEAGKLLKQAGFQFDKAYTSAQKRTIHTDGIVRIHAEQAHLIPVHDERMNERDYGKLTGLIKTDPKTLEKHGEIIKQSRRGYSARPPGGESLEDVHLNRVKPFYEEVLAPLLKNSGQKASHEGHVDTFNKNLPSEDMDGMQIYNSALPEDVENILITGHGNSLRALLIVAGAETTESIEYVELATGVPEVLEFSDDGKYLRRYKLEPQPEPVVAPVPELAF
jgi:2,3-bisphosphoglycerate-dependent phosphoglycerate mutase